MLAGAALGGAAIQALHAQAKPPVYMIAINEVRTGNAVSGRPTSRPGRDSSMGRGIEALEGWRNSLEFQAALKIGEKYAKFNIVAVNGLK